MMKTFIKKLSTSLVVVLIFPGAIEYCPAQELSNTAWNNIILLQFSNPLGSSNWEYSHPSYNTTGGVQTIKETGSFNLNSIFNGQLELSKGYLGFGAGIGVYPAILKVDKNEDPFNVNSFFLEIEALFFPLQNSTAKLTPVIKFGGGTVKSSGDLDNSALYISFGGGLRTFFTNKLGVSLLFKGRHFDYNEIPLTETITGDIKFTNYSIQLGFLLTF